MMSSRCSASASSSFNGLAEGDGFCLDAPLISRLDRTVAGSGRFLQKYRPGEDFIHLDELTKALSRADMNARGKLS